MKTTLEKAITKGMILEKNLKLLNDYLVTHEGTSISFSEFLRKKGTSINIFMKPLPQDHVFADIDKWTLDSIAGRGKIREYTNDLNDLYLEQYMDFRIAEEQEYGAVGDDDIYNARGRGRRQARKAKRQEKKAERKENRNTIKDERKKFKAEKKVLKNKLKSGEISKANYKNYIKRGRKDKRNKIREAGGTRFGKFIRVANKLNPAAVAIRNSALMLIRLNVFNIAGKLNKAKELGGDTWKKVIRIWATFGGSPKVFLKQIDKGKAKRPLLAKAKDGTKPRRGKRRRMQADGEDGAMYYPTGVEESAVLTAMTAAAAIITPIAALLKKDDKDEGETFAPPTGDSIPIDPQTEDEINKTLAGKEDGIDAGDFMEQVKVKKWWIIGGLGITTVAIIIIASLKKKK